jgi:hypothetical protein
MDYNYLKNNLKTTETFYISEIKIIQILEAIL